jgi:coenzyme Q-binding protein COQ10
MTSIRRSALVPYSAREMYQLVADIESYPQFLPWCGGARIISRDQEYAVASIDIAYHRIGKTFTTRNRLQPDELMEVYLVEGPFKHLHGFWRFEALAARSSRISLHLEFDFASRMLALTLGPVFSSIANSLVDSFRRRAVDFYGEREWEV